MNEMSLAIASASDEKFSTGLGVMMCSALLCAKQKSVVFHIFDDGMHEITKRRLADRVDRVARTIGIDVELNYIDFSRLELPKLPDVRGSLATYGRIFLPEILKEDSVFYVDADIICNREFPLAIEYLNQYPDALLVGCLDPLAELAEDCPWKDQLRDGEHTLPYINCGFMWMNLKALREIGLTDKFRLLMKKGAQMRFRDQTSLNFLCRGRIGLMPPEFNHFWSQCPGRDRRSRQDVLQMDDLGNDHRYNIHFVGKTKPWNGNPERSNVFCIHHFNMTARYFGFSQNRVSKLYSMMLAACHHAELHLKLAWYRLTRNKRSTRARMAMDRIRKLSDLSAAYETKLKSLAFARLD